jgi:molybdopterin synthase catalytic subunit
MSTMSSMPTSPLSAPAGDDWCALTEMPLPIGQLYEWAVRRDCGAIVLFSGTVRDHADGRTGVSLLEYEAYEKHVVPKLQEIVDEVRRQWPSMGRVGILHRVGPLALGESSVVVVVSSPHRPEAFEAARFGIDALKATVPIWKREHWEGGVDWGFAATQISDVGLIEPVSSHHLSDANEYSQESSGVKQ